MKKLRYPPFKWKLYMVNEETLKDVLIDKCKGMIVYIFVLDLSFYLQLLCFK